MRNPRFVDKASQTAPQLFCHKKANKEITVIQHCLVVVQRTPEEVSMTEEDKEVAEDQPEEEAGETNSDLQQLDLDEAMLEKEDEP